MKLSCSELNLIPSEQRPPCRAVEHVLRENTCKQTGFGRYDRGSSECLGSSLCCPIIKQQTTVVFKSPANCVESREHVKPSECGLICVELCSVLSRSFLFEFESFRKTFDRPLAR